MKQFYKVMAVVWLIIIIAVVSVWSYKSFAKLNEQQDKPAKDYHRIVGK